MATSLPVVFMKPSGEISATEPIGAPMLTVAFRNDPAHGSGPRRVTAREIHALVDTGADLNYADPSLIAEHHLAPIGDSVVRGATSTAPGKRYVAHLFFPTAGLQMETDVISADLVANGRPYTLILGMLFIRTGALILDFRSRDFRFVLDGSSEEKAVERWAFGPVHGVRTSFK